jgi:hypothetical protein
MILTALLLLLLFATPALAAERIDLFDQLGRRTGYAVVDRESGRVDYYDAQSRHTGWGKADAKGRAERFGMDGKRREGTVLPVAPASKSSR